MCVFIGEFLRSLYTGIRNFLKFIHRQAKKMSNYTSKRTPTTNSVETILEGFIPSPETPNGINFKKDNNPVSKSSPKSAPKSTSKPDTDKDIVLQSSSKPDADKDLVLENKINHFTIISFLKGAYQARVTQKNLKAFTKIFLLIGAIRARVIQKQQQEITNTYLEESYLDHLDSIDVEAELENGTSLDATIRKGREVTNTLRKVASCGTHYKHDKDTSVYDSSRSTSSFCFNCNNKHIKLNDFDKKSLVINNTWIQLFSIRAGVPQ